MTQMQETGSTDTAVYAASMIVCGNAEEIAGAGRADPTGNGWADEAREAHAAAVAVIQKAGYDYATESNFRDWNGGRYYRKAQVHVRWWRAALEVETDEDGETEVVGAFRPCDESEVPTECRSDAEEVADKALFAMAATMERLMEEVVADHERAVEESEDAD